MKSKITQSYVAGGYSGSVGQSFDNAMEDINKDIQILEDYRRFESSHASDFSTVSATWDNIDTYLDRLKKEGGYDASSNTYPSVDFSQEKFYKELSSYNASQKDHYEVQRIAVKTDHGYTYEYRMYKNGLYDPEATDKFNQLQKKAEMGQAVDFFKEVVGINDYIRMVDGIDPLTGKKITNNEQAISSLMFLLTVVTEATALKVLKNFKKGKNILDDIDLNSELPNHMKKWDYPPNKNLYSKYEKVYKNPKYYDQETGKLNWPANNGFEGTPYERITQVGEIFDRYGEPSGEFLAKSGTPFEQRALAPHSETAKYYQYKVEKIFKIVEGKVAPYFDQPGGGTQLYGVTPKGKILTVEELLRKGYLVPIN
ncbi:glycohydrolase toxin TNT-related protein [Listeria kieliensis]